MDVSAERPALTILQNARGAADWIKRSVLAVRSHEARCSEENWQAPLLAHVFCEDGVVDAILSPRPGCHHKYAWPSVEARRGASARKVTGVGPELCPE